MRLTDLTVEVRDKDLNRVGQLLASDLVGATFVTRHNNTGSFELIVAAASNMVDLLRTPGFGIILLGPQGTVLSGYVTAAKLTQDQNDVQGSWVISGVSDAVLLNERLAYPDPSNPDVSTQIRANDKRVGLAEDVIKGYVSDNIGPTAPAVRRVAGLSIEASGLRGLSVSGSARFNTLQDLIYPLAQTGGIGYQLKQDGAGLVFSVYQPRDLSADIRLDIQNGKLAATEYNYAAPQATRVIVAGQGEAENRLFLERTSADSLNSETLWKRRIEVFKDARDLADPLELQQRGDEVLVDLGKTIVAMAVQPSDGINMRYGFEWGLGDKITVVVNDIEAVAVVTEVGISIQADGVRVAASVGTPVALEYEAKVLARQEDHEERINSLERSASGYNRTQPYEAQGGTNGTQPVFSGPAITGSFNRFGSLVHFSIQVDFDNIVSFGTGQYYLTLPFPARVPYKLRDGCLHDASTGRTYHISGHVNAGSNVIWLFSTDISGQALYDFEFSFDTPVLLTTADNFHIAGTYEIEE